MDSFLHLRTHSRVVQKGGRPLVSVGYAFRRRNAREADVRNAERERERELAYLNSPDCPGLTALGRARRLAALNRDSQAPGQEPEGADPLDRSEPPARS